MRLFEKIAPIHRLPPRICAPVVGGAPSVFLVAVGVVLDKSVAWLLIAITLTVIVLFAVADWVERSGKIEVVEATDADERSLRSRGLNSAVPR